MVDALRLSTLLLFDCTRFIKNQSSLIFEQICKNKFTLPIYHWQPLKI